MIAGVEEDPVNYVDNRLYVSETEWKGIEKQHVNELPYDINGTHQSDIVRLMLF